MSREVCPGRCILRYYPKVCAALWDSEIEVCQLTFSVSALFCELAGLGYGRQGDSGLPPGREGGLGLQEV